jgi:hypothetical protein
LAICTMNASASPSTSAARLMAGTFPFRDCNTSDCAFESVLGASRSCSLRFSFLSRSVSRSASAVLDSYLASCLSPATRALSWEGRPESPGQRDRAVGAQFRTLDARRRVDLAVRAARPRHRPASR